MAFGAGAAAGSAAPIRPDVTMISALTMAASTTTASSAPRRLLLYAGWVVLRPVACILMLSLPVTAGRPSFMEGIVSQAGRRSIGQAPNRPYGSYLKIVAAPRAIPGRAGPAA